MRQGFQWIISSLVGISAAYLVWLTMLQTTPWEHRGIALSLALSAALSVLCHWLLARLVPIGLSNDQRGPVIILAAVCLVSGALAASYAGRLLPENRLLLPNNRLEITALTEHHPESSGNAVCLYWFNTSAGDISFSNFSQSGLWSQTSDG